MWNSGSEDDDDEDDDDEYDDDDDDDDDDSNAVKDVEEEISNGIHNNLLWYNSIFWRKIDGKK